MASKEKTAKISLSPFELGSEASNLLKPPPPGSQAARMLQPVNLNKKVVSPVKFTPPPPPAKSETSWWDIVKNIPSNMLRTASGLVSGLGNIAADAVKVPVGVVAGTIPAETISAFGGTPSKWMQYLERMSNNSAKGLIQSALSIPAAGVEGIDKVLSVPSMPIRHFASQGVFGDTAKHEITKHPEDLTLGHWWNKVAHAINNASNTNLVAPLPEHAPPRTEEEVKDWVNRSFGHPLQTLLQLGVLYDPAGKAAGRIMTAPFKAVKETGKAIAHGPLQVLPNELSAFEPHSGIRAKVNTALNKATEWANKKANPTVDPTTDLIETTKQEFGAKEPTAGPVSYESAEPPAPPKPNPLAKFLLGDTKLQLLARRYFADPDKMAEETQAAWQPAAERAADARSKVLHDTVTRMTTHKPEFGTPDNLVFSDEVFKSMENAYGATINSLYNKMRDYKLTKKTKAQIREELTSSHTYKDIGVKLKVNGEDRYYRANELDKMSTPEGLRVENGTVPWNNVGFGNITGMKVGKYGGSTIRAAIGNGFRTILSNKPELAGRWLKTLQRGVKDIDDLHTAELERLPSMARNFETGKNLSNLLAYDSLRDRYPHPFKIPIAKERVTQEEALDKAAQNFSEGQLSPFTKNVIYNANATESLFNSVRSIFNAKKAQFMPVAKKLSEYIEGLPKDEQANFKAVVGKALGPLQRNTAADLSLGLLQDVKIGNNHFPATDEIVKMDPNFVDKIVDEFRNQTLRDKTWGVVKTPDVHVTLSEEVPDKLIPDTVREKGPDAVAQAQRRWNEARPYLEELQNYKIKEVLTLTMENPELAKDMFSHIFHLKQQYWPYVSEELRRHYNGVVFKETRLTPEQSDMTKAMGLALDESAVPVKAMVYQMSELASDIAHLQFAQNFARVVANELATNPDNYVEVPMRPIRYESMDPKAVPIIRKAFKDREMDPSRPVPVDAAEFLESQTTKPSKAYSWHDLPGLAGDIAGGMWDQAIKNKTLRTITTALHNGLSHFSLYLGAYAHYLKKSPAIAIQDFIHNMGQFYTKTGQIKLNQDIPVGKGRFIPMKDATEDLGLANVYNQYGAQVGSEMPAGEFGQNVPATALHARNLPVELSLKYGRVANPIYTWDYWKAIRDNFKAGRGGKITPGQMFERLDPALTSTAAQIAKTVNSFMRGTDRWQAIKDLGRSIDAKFLHQYAHGVLSMTPTKLTLYQKLLEKNMPEFEEMLRQHGYDPKTVHGNFSSWKPFAQDIFREYKQKYIRLIGDELSDYRNEPAGVRTISNTIFPFFTWGWFAFGKYPRLLERFPKWASAIYQAGQQIETLAHMAPPGTPNQPSYADIANRVESGKGQFPFYGYRRTMPPATPGGPPTLTDNTRLVPLHFLANFLQAYYNPTESLGDIAGKQILKSPILEGISTALGEPAHRGMTSWAQILNPTSGSGKTATGFLDWISPFAMPYKVQQVLGQAIPRLEGHRIQMWPTGTPTIADVLMSLAGFPTRTMGPHELSRNAAYWMMHKGKKDLNRTLWNLRKADDMSPENINNALKDYSGIIPKVLTILRGDRPPGGWF